MSRFLLRNTVRDPKYAALRKMNESQVVLRPFVGGKPLPPAATRILVLSDLTAPLLAEIERLCSIGNVEFTVVGRGGPAVDFAAIRQQLGFGTVTVTVPAPQIVHASVAEEPAAEVAVLAAAPEEIAAPAEEPVTAPATEEVVASDDVAAEELIEEQEAVASGKVWTREELEASKLTELRDILIALGGKPAGKNKATVVDEIVAAQETANAAN